MLSRLTLLAITAAHLISPPVHADELADAVTLLEQGWQVRAEKQLETLADRDPDRAEVWYQRAWARFYVNDFSKAEKFIDKAVKLEPDNTGFLVLQGYIVGSRARDGSKLKASGRAKKYRNINRRVLELDPGNVEAYKALIQFHIKAPGLFGGDKDEARALAKALREIDPVEGHIMQGMIHENVDDDGESALEEFRLAYRAGLEHPEFSGRESWILMDALYRNKRYDEAEALMKEGTGIPGREAASHQGLARLYQFREDWEGARSQWEVLTAVDSTRTRGLAGLGHLAEARGEWATAVAMFDSAYAVDPDRRDLLYQAARARLNGKLEGDRAADEFEAYLDQELNRSWPSEGWARARLAEALWINGDVKSARDQLKIAKKHVGKDSRLEDETDRLEKDMRAPRDDGEF